MENTDAAAHAREFMRELRRHSINQENPIAEWDLLDSVGHSERGAWCICKKSIKRLFYILNKITGERLQIGSDCARRWLDCSMECAGCGAPLHNTLKRREDGLFHCPYCVKIMRRLQDTPVLTQNDRRWTTYYELAQDEDFVNHIVNTTVKRDWMIHFLGYCRFFYSW